MATRKEEKERLRAARLEAERREALAARKRLILGYGAAGILTLAVLVGIVVAISSGGGGSDGDTPAAAHIDTATGSLNGAPPDSREGTTPPAVAEPRPGERGRRRRLHPAPQFPNEGANHLEPGSKAPDYGTNPPTSGNHVTSPFQQADGAYAETPELIQFVHSLEHGRIEIQYAPDLPEADQLALKGVFDESPSGVLMFPNPDMPYEVAATAWTQLMGCKRYEGAKTLDAIRDFRDQFRGRGPEASPDHPIARRGLTHSPRLLPPPCSTGARGGWWRSPTRARSAPATRTAARSTSGRRVRGEEHQALACESRNRPRQVKATMTSSIHRCESEARPGSP